MMPRLLVALCLSAVVAMAPAARAQSTDTALAEALYQQGRDLMRQGEYGHACEKFAESQRLDPATGTLLNLAACHEKVGKLASAWIEYYKAAATARRDGREDRVEYAQQRIAAIEPQLSRLTLRIADKARVPELRILLDGVEIGDAAIGLPAPVDPGIHKVEANAPGKQPWSQEIRIAEQAEETLTIPVLADAPRSAESPPLTETRLATTSSPTEDVRHERRPIPISVWISGGTTLALATAGIVTGVIYLNQQSDYDALNDSDEATPKTRQDASDKAKRMGVINASLWVGAGVGAAVTTALFLTRPSAEERAAQLTPWVDPSGGGGLIWRGAL